jgi:hypothetical protein
VKVEIERWAKADGISVNQLVAVAVAEKLAAMDAAGFFSERRPWAGFKEFKGGEPPGPDDRIPDR